MIRQSFDWLMGNGWLRKCVKGKSNTTNKEKQQLTLFSCQNISKYSKETGKRVQCNRMSPCSSCVTAGFDCQQGNLMVFAVPTKLSKRHSLVEASECQSGSPPILPRHVAQDSAGPWTSEPQVTQNLDSTWISKSETQLLESSPLRPHLRTGKLTSRYENRQEKIGDAHRSSVPNSHSRSRGIKRKANQYDFDFTPELASPEPSGEIDSSASIVALPKQKKAAINKGGYVKYHASVQDDKPEPYGEPPVWADKRQSLCETLPYYKAYQSGAYITCGIVRAFMCDKEVGPRDKFDEEIMIARV
jgi:hypothetical protein